MTSKILIVNPNSSESVTGNLKNILLAPPQIEFEFYTAPSLAPKEISGTETSIQSEKIVIEDLSKREDLNSYDGFLICCYSDHPLIYSLAKFTDKPILGIMQATLLYSLLNPSIRKLFILTSFSEWGPLLDKGIEDFVGCSNFPGSKFQRTKALNVSVLSLSDPREYAKIFNRVNTILKEEYSNDNIDCVLLGCAGMAGLDEKLTADFPHIKFIDSVKAGVEFLNTLIRINKAI